MGKLEVSEAQFRMDGKPIRLISGAIHYFRIVPEYWRDRLLKLKACGFNTVETYVAWNVHEPEEGRFRFEGMADLVRFVEIAGELGLHVIVRPSPYICAEWEFGGLPAWLLGYEGIRLRCMDPVYLGKVDAYYDVLIPKLVPLLSTNGGPVDVFDRMLAAGASVNFYMFHGGTNFGFYNGANHGGVYEPTVTSYDYDAPLSESGDVTEKYEAIRSVLQKYEAIGDTPLPEPIPKRSYGAVRLTERAGLFAGLDLLSVPVRRTCPEPMEKLGQSYGFILYSTTVSGPRRGESLHLQEVHDRALVFLDGAYAGTVERWDPKPLKLDIPAEGARLDILVENMGRINYGPHLKDFKGITEGVRLNNQFLFHWTIRPLPLDKLDGLVYEPPGTGSGTEGPAFYRGTMEVDHPADTFVRLDGWTKGVVWVNGFNLGRYWERGPQKTLYLPGPLLRQGRNEIVVFELHGSDRPEIRLEDRPDLG